MYEGWQRLQPGSCSLGCKKLQRGRDAKKRMLAQTQFLTREINKVPDLDKRLFKFGIFFAMANYTKVHQSSPFCISWSAMESPFLHLLDAVVHHTQYYPPTHPSASFQQIVSVSQNPFFLPQHFLLVTF